MKKLILIAMAVGLAGCQTAEQRRVESEQAYAQFERIDNFMCTSLHGTAAGTAEHKRCRLRVALERVAAGNAQQERRNFENRLIDAVQTPRNTSCSRNAGGDLNCYSY